MDHERFIESGEGITVCKNENMICANCRYSTGQAAECEKYRTKPFSVIDGGKDCPKFSPRCDNGSDKFS
mgnify:CR=1 FL=1